MTQEEKQQAHDILCKRYDETAQKAVAASKTDPTNSDPDKLGDLLEDTNNVK